MDENFGQRIKELREERNLSLMSLARAIGVSDTAVYKWENGIAEPKLTYIARMADFFGCTADHLIGRTDEFGWNAPAAPLSLEERQMLDRFRALPPQMRRVAEETLEFWASKKL